MLPSNELLCPIANAVYKADGVVTSVNQLGIFAIVGPLRVFTSNHVWSFEAYNFMAG